MTAFGGLIDRHQGDGARRLRLRHQAVRDRRPARHPEAGLRARRHEQRGLGAAPRARQERGRARAHRRQLEADAGGLQAHRQGGRLGRDRPHHRRVRHRQGAGGGGAASGKQAQPASAREGQLRGAAGDAARDRAVRPREGLVHRRDDDAQGPLRDRQQGHDLPRRDRRDDRWRPRRSCCASSRSASSSASARTCRSRSTSASSPPRTATWPRRSRRATSARTSTTGST